MPKRLILCLDGTWDSDLSTQRHPILPSNIARLSRMIARQSTSSDGKPIEQVVYYQSGVGTGALNLWDRLYQGITGFGVKENLISAYHFVATNYSSGDEILLFGYSRGAYTARALGWFLTTVGVMKPEDLDEFPLVFRTLEGKVGDGKLAFDDESKFAALRGWTASGSLESENEEGERGELKPRTQKKTLPVPVEIVVEGVWDTVGSLGLPDSWLARITGFNKRYQFYNTALNDKVYHAFQALGIDEHRGAFSPCIWYLEPELKDKVELKQCWFPGFHGDVGGGVAGPLGRNHLAIEDITLAWMCDQVDGLLTFDEQESRNILGEIKEDVTWGVTMEKDPTGWLYTLRVAGSSIPRTPGSYHNTLENNVSEGSGRCTTNETIHPSVKLLIDDPEAHYFPKGLDVQISSNLAQAPRWIFEDKVQSGHGAFWTRPAGKSGETTIILKEHVIQDTHERNNFEANLLPLSVRNKLYWRNRRELDRLQSRDIATRNMTWSRQRGYVPW